MCIDFKIARKGTEIYCFFENALCCVSATEFGLYFLLKLTESATYHSNSHPSSFALSFPSPLFFFHGKSKSDCYVMTETCCFFPALSTAGSTVSSEY